MCLFQEVFKLVSEYLVGICQLAEYFHQLVYMDLVNSCVHFNVTHIRGDVPVWDDSVHTVVSCISCTHILGEIEVWIIVCNFS